MINPNYMPGENQFDPNTQIFELKDLVAQMTPEQLERHQAAMKRGESEEPLREARAMVDYKKNQAAAAVRSRELASYKEERAANKLLCLDIANAIHDNETTALDLYIKTYLKDKLSFKQPESIEEIQDIFNRLSNRPEELIDIGQPELPRVEMRTVYCEVPVQNEKIMMAITATVDYTYNAEEPLVTFVVSKAPVPKKESLQAVVPLSKTKKVEAAPSLLGKAFAYGKKLFGLK